MNINGTMETAENSSIGNGNVANCTLSLEHLDGVGSCSSSRRSDMNIIRCLSSGSFTTMTTAATSTTLSSCTSAPTILRSSSSTFSSGSSASSSRWIRNKSEDDATVIEPTPGTYKGTYRKPISRRSFTEFQKQQHEEVEEELRLLQQQQPQPLQANDGGGVDEEEEADVQIWGTRRHRSAPLSGTTKSVTCSPSLIEEDEENNLDEDEEEDILRLLLSSDEYRRSYNSDYLLSAGVLCGSEEVAWQMQCIAFMQSKNGIASDLSKEYRSPTNVEDITQAEKGTQTYENLDDKEDDEYNREVHQYLFELDQAIVLSQESEQERRRSELDSQVALEMQCKLMLEGQLVSGEKIATSSLCNGLEISLHPCTDDYVTDGIESKTADVDLAVKLQCQLDEEEKLRIREMEQCDEELAWKIYHDLQGEVQVDREENEDGRYRQEEQQRCDILLQNQNSPDGKESDLAPFDGISKNITFPVVRSVTHETPQQLCNESCLNHNKLSVSIKNSCDKKCRSRLALRRFSSRTVGQDTSTAWTSTSIGTAGAGFESETDEQKPQKRHTTIFAPLRRTSCRSQALNPRRMSSFFSSDKK